MGNDSDATTELGEISPPPEPSEYLARALRDEMEHLDPTETGDISWERLDARDREFYVSCVERMFLRHSKIILACLRKFTDNGGIDGNSGGKEDAGERK